MAYQRDRIGCGWHTTNFKNSSRTRSWIQPSYSVENGPCRPFDITNMELKVTDSAFEVCLVRGVKEESLASTSVDQRAQR